MGRHKGELSPGRVDREWPHQIMLPWDDAGGRNYEPVRAFCADLSLCPRGHSIVKDDKWHHVFCFREKADAEKFQAKFGGDWFDPAQRGRGRSWSKIRPPKQKFY
jgi:hypothetical protein